MNYEIFDLLEFGNASALIQEKCIIDLDELAEPLGISAEALDE